MLCFVFLFLQTKQHHKAEKNTSNNIFLVLLVISISQV